MISSVSFGGYVASELCAVMEPCRPLRNQSAQTVLYCHGRGLTGMWGVTSETLLHRLADTGYTVVSCDLGGDLWGNDTYATRIGQAWTYAKSAYGVKTDKFHVIGVSMGALALNYVRANPSLVRSFTGIVPALAPKDIRDNNREGLAASINTAYGGAAAFDAAAATHDPLLAVAGHAAQSVPMLMLSSTDDTIALDSKAQEFCAAVPTATYRSRGAVGHSTPLSSEDAQAIVNFVVTQ